VHREEIEQNNVTSNPENTKKERNARNKLSPLIEIY